ncbi:uncharacterized protein Tco025E_09650 [Trypanosoma conorhini]|uniref:Uncharacterized protein n=1 Tax=Trypanosoma conorhini TaxID=83891 RepID=A0A422MU99_9TRYP|nr:uncharacterized protein Tco025E_09650 [Trypanosoma conorhini]RNE96773.1 hypothetical protein Tco025E_09650 [Trypanosoma conorhini]
MANPPPQRSAPTPWRECAPPRLTSLCGARPCIAGGASPECAGAWRASLRGPAPTAPRRLQGTRGRIQQEHRRQWRSGFLGSGHCDCPAPQAWEAGQMLPTSLRPVALTSCPRKLAERIAARRIRGTVEAQLLP